MRGPKSVARGAKEIAFQRFLRRESNRVEKKIKAIGLGLHLFKKRRDLAVARDVARIERRLRAEFGDEFLDVFLEPFTLVIENEARAGRRPNLCDSPCDASFIGDPEDDARFSRQKLIPHNDMTLAALCRSESRGRLGRRGRFFSFSVRSRPAKLNHESESDRDAQGDR